MADVPPDDGLPAREVGLWTTYKLAIVETYTNHFATVCKNHAKKWFFVDGFAGPGVNTVKGSGERVWGSPMLGLRAQPPFALSIATDLSVSNIDALRARATTEGFADRAVIEVADCNTDLLPLMTQHISGGDRYRPCLALLDPEGPHLAWETVAAMSRFRLGRRKVEQLILLPTHMGFIRELPLHKPITEWAERDLRRVYGNDDWREIWQRRLQTGDTDRATTEYVRLYEEQLRALGYAYVQDLEVKMDGDRGPTLYFLIFASDHPVGHRIMGHLMDTVMRRIEEPSGQQTLNIRTPRRRRTRD